MFVTGWSDIITAAMEIIDDVRWREELAVNPAQFYRAKSMAVSFALPYMSRPPELFTHLANGMTDPKYGDMEWISTEESMLELTTLYTGMIDYELCSVSVRSQDGMTYVPYNDAVYDSSLGTVTFPAQSDAGIEYSIDFYNDGSFADLTSTQMMLFAQAVAVVWDEKFARDWLSNKMKIHDSSFETINESNYMRQTNERYLTNYQAFNDMLRKYEQDCAYAAVMSNNSKTLV